MQEWWFPIALGGYFLWRFVRLQRVKRLLPTLLSQGARVVDVRSRAEFSAGARAGSLNIPLDELDRGTNDLDREKPIILCCASGTRSSMAAAVLKRKGFKNVVNAGAWTNVLAEKI